MKDVKIITKMELISISIVPGSMLVDLACRIIEYIETTPTEDIKENSNE